MLITKYWNLKATIILVAMTTISEDSGWKGNMGNTVSSTMYKTLKLVSERESPLTIESLDQFWPKNTSRERANFYLAISCIIKMETKTLKVNFFDMFWLRKICKITNTLSLPIVITVVYILKYGCMSTTFIFNSYIPTVKHSFILITHKWV